MSISYDIADLINNLIDLEKSGNDFYTTLAERSDDLSLQQLYHNLAEEEKKHQAIYQEILKESDIEIDIDEDYHSYLQVIIQEQFGLDPDKISECKTTDDALNLAIQLEKDSLLFLSEFGSLISSNNIELVDKMKKEERKHLQLLITIRQKLSKK